MLQLLTYVPWESHVKHMDVHERLDSPGFTHSKKTGVGDPAHDLDDILNLGIVHSLLEIGLCWDDFAFP